MSKRRIGYLLTAVALLALLAACGGGLGLFQEPSPGNVPPDRLALIDGGGGQFLVPVQIGNQTFRLLVDTGFEATLVFADLVRADNTAVVRTGERANLQFGSGRRRGEIATAPLQVGQRSGTARLLLVDNPTSATDPSLTWKGADGILGLRFQPGATDLGGARLDAPLLALAPRIRSMEFDLQPGGASLVLGGTPVLGSANPGAVFTAQTTTEVRSDRIRENYADLEAPFQISSSRGVVADEDLDILLDTGAASLLVLDEPLAAQLGYDRGAESWSIPPEEPLDLRLIGLAGQMPLTPAFQVRDVRVTDLSHTTFDAVLGLDRWQQYVVGFDFIDFSLGGPEGTFRFLRHDQIGTATGGCQRPDQHFVALRGLNSSGEDGSPALSADGRVIVFETDRHGGRGLRDIAYYDRQAQALVDLGSINSESNDETPVVSGDGNLIAFTSDRLGGQGDFDIYLYDVAAGSFIDLPGLNTAALERSPGLSADGRWISFRSERNAGDSPSDVYLYDRQTATLVATPGLNSPADEFTSALSRDGQRLVFEALNRPGDVGGVDVHLYDVAAGALLPLSAVVNSDRFDAFVNLSANGRWMTFFSERAAATPGAAGRDILLVDLGQNGSDGRPGVLVDLPGLNSAYEESSSSLNQDGSLIAFASSRCGGSGGLDIYLYQRD